MVEYEALQGGKAEPVQLSKSPSGPPMGFPGSVGKAVNAILDEIAAASYPALGQDFSRRAQARLGYEPEMPRGASDWSCVASGHSP